MIQIERTPNAYSRTGGMKIEKDDLVKATATHMNHVAQAMALFARMMLDSAVKHDNTKLEYMNDFYKDMTTLTPGEEFKTGKWYKIHVETERHHLNSRVPDDVNLVDLMEYIADCVMAGLSRTGKVYDISLSDEILQRAFSNTVSLLKENVEILE